MLELGQHFGGSILSARGNDRRIVWAVDNGRRFPERAIQRESCAGVSVEPGDRVVIYTDGFIETFNAREEMLGLDGFRDIVREASTLTVANMKQAIVERVAAWRNGPPTDDMSLVVVGIPQGTESAAQSFTSLMPH